SIPRRAPMRAITAGPVEMPRIEATPMPSRSRPICALSTPSADLMSGTREAQVAIDVPLARKIAKIALRQRTYCERVRAKSIERAYRIDSIDVNISRYPRCMTADAAARRATLADVARRAEVSTSTASVVFSGKTRVSEAARERVLAAAAA